MSSIIIPKSTQQNADDFLAGPRTVKITAVKITPGKEQPCAISFEGDDGKPYFPCKSMARVLVNCWGPDAKAYIGRSMTLFCDPRVKWGGMAVGGIRISHMTDIDRDVTMALTETKQSRKPFTVRPLHVQIGPSRADLEAAARAAAERGGDAFRAFFKEITAEDRAYLKPTISTYQEIATVSDKSAQPAGDGADGIPSEGIVS